MQLNSDQNRAVLHHEGACIVTATPGSGKTRVLTERVIHLIKERNVLPRNILCLTFTNKAANEMKERIQSTLGEESDSIWVSTFHRLCIAVLKKHGELVGLSPIFSIYASKEQEELMTKIARMNDHNDVSRSGIFGLIKAANDFREDIVDFEQHIQELNPSGADTVQEYLKTLDKFNAVDFSGILYKAWLIISEHPSVVEAMSRRFKFVLVDEMQDTNHIQYDLVKRISSHGNIFVVCDPNQSVYGWRGAKPENIAKIHKGFDNVQEIILPKNYRSTARILEASQKLIRNNKDASNVQLDAARGDGADICIRPCLHPDDEAEVLVNRIQSLKVTYNYSWNDFAVLYRLNSLSRSPEIALRNQSIPYRIVGGFSFFDRSEIKTTLAYLSLLANPKDTIAFARAISTPKRSIGSTIIGKLERASEESNIPILEAAREVNMLPIPRMSEKAKSNLSRFVNVVTNYQEELESGMGIGDAAKGLIQDSGYWEHVKKQSETDEQDKRRFDNVEELISSILDYQKRQPKSTMSEYLQTLQLMSPDQNEQDLDEAVTLLTMHGAKGLEWSCVSIIGAEEGYLPHARAVAERGESEERRLMYVAMTRSRDFLFISYCQNRIKFKNSSKGSRTMICEPSRFIAELSAGDSHEKQIHTQTDEGFG